MQLASRPCTQQNILGLIVFVLASLLLFSKFAQVGSAVQSGNRTVENQVPAQVPLRIKIKKEKEEKIRTSPQWYKDFEMEITNTSDKPIYFFSLFIKMPGVTNDDGITMVFDVRFGRPELIDADLRPTADDKPLLTRETYTFVIPAQKQLAWEAWQKRNNEFDVPKLEIIFSHLSFGDGTGFTSTGGVPFPQRHPH